MANGDQFITNPELIPVETPPTFLKLTNYVDINLPTMEVYPPQLLQYGDSEGAQLPLFVDSMSSGQSVA